MKNFAEWPAVLQKQASFIQDVLINISQAGFSQFNTSTPQEVIFNQLLKTIQNGLVITWLSLCDKQVPVCYGCGSNFRLDTQNHPQPYNLILVAKQRCEFIKDGVKLQSCPANAYFHVQVITCFALPLSVCKGKCLHFKYLMYTSMWMLLMLFSYAWSFDVST